MERKIPFNKAFRRARTRFSPLPFVHGATLLALMGLLGACAIPYHEIKEPAQSLVPVRCFYPGFEDDLDRESMALALKNNLAYLKRVKPDTPFVYGPHTFTCAQVLASQEAFMRLLETCFDPGEWRQRLQKEFLVYRAVGRPGRGDVLFTGYFEPLYEARLIADSEFRHPLYQKPSDMLEIDLSLFHPRYEGQKVLARWDGKGIFPYFTRRQIDEGGALGGKGLELAYLRDPLDAFFLHIQGSGRLRLEDGSTILVGYAGANGRPYRSIGSVMIQKGLLTREEMSMQSIRRVLSQQPQDMYDILYENPSYIFFRRLEQGPLGNIGVPLTPGRSIALDAGIFPKGALAFIASQKPTLDAKGSITGWGPFSRFVLNQDTGTAIKGAGRADLFWGSGSYAEAAAGHMQHEGVLYILIQRPREAAPMEEQR